MFGKVLIANRGEIACRIAAVCRQMGVATVGVCSEVEQRAKHARMVDEVVAIGPARVQESYLCGDRIIAVARERGAEAIHPGYGLLSENAGFAGACREAGLVFVGPSPEVIALMGDKARARALAAEVGVPVLPGSAGSLGDDGAAVDEAGRVGYPVMIKAVFGGGGIGMGRARDEGELGKLLRRARDRARSAFGRAEVYLEKCLEPARHIEIQVLFDGEGRGIHLFERECSVQRRHQKVVEESPSPLLAERPELRERMAEAALALCRASGYVNAGTVEFLVDGQDGFYFLEMNTRLQVEHPVTECVTGIPLIEWQLRVAAGERLGWAQGDVEMNGAAVQCRVYAEDPARGYLPQPGHIERLAWPEGVGVRVDAGYDEGDTVTPYYDPLLGKVITCGRNREAALGRMRAALGGFELAGVGTNAGLLGRLMDDGTFISGRLHTGMLEEMRR